MLYYIWYGLLILRDFSQPFKIESRYITIPLMMVILFDLCIHIQKNKLKIPKAMVLFGVYVICLIAFNFNVVSLLFIFLCCYVLKDINLSRLFLVTIFFEIVCIIFLLIGISRGTIPDELYSTAYKGGSLSHKLGFRNTNYAAYAFVNLIVALYYLGIKHRNLVFYLLGIGVSLAVFYYTTSRTLFALELILFFTGLFLTSRKILKRVRLWLILLPVLLTILLSIILYYTVISEGKNQFINAINRTFSGRFGYYLMVLRLMTAKNIFFGFVLDMEDVVIDQAYIALFMNGGIIALIGLFYYYLKFLNPRSLYRHKYLVPIVVAVLIGGFAEQLFSYHTALSVTFWLILYKGACYANKKQFDLPHRQKA